jgi:anaerobic selenocysteine-containing dehydrogenase
MRARISEAVHPGVIRIAWGWGEVNPESNVNSLTDDDRRDPITSTPSNRCFMCRIET